MRDVSRAAERLANAQRQVSSGERIQVASDDPNGTASLVGELATVKRLDAYSQAGDAATSRLSVVDSALTDIVNQLTAAKTTALAGRGSTQTTDQRSALAAAMLSIRDALLSDVNTTFHGTALFAGSSGASAAYAQAGGAFTYQGDTSGSAIDVGFNRTVQLTLDGQAMFQGSDPRNILDSLTDLADAITRGDDTAIGQGVAALETAFDRATAVQSQVGTWLRAIDDTRPQIQAAKLAASGRASTLRDADMAAAVSEMSNADASYRAALQVVATNGQLTLLDYLK